MNNILRIESSSGSYNDSWARMAPGCIEDIQDILKDRRLIGKFRPNYKRRLDFLKETWRNCISHPEWFEKLLNEEDIYSLHIANVDNIRILFVFHGEQVWQLCAFKEKERGKRKSYRQYIPIARERLNKWLEEEENV